MIDSHCHLYFDAYDADRPEVIRSCEEKLRAVINIGINYETSRAAIDLTHASPIFFASIGFHPEEGPQIEQSEVNIKQALDELKNDTIESRSKIVAIGEIGLDYHESPAEIHKNMQKDIFEAQIEYALQNKMPVIIHSRDAFTDTYKILSNSRMGGTLEGVWHSFTGNSTEVKQILDLGLYIGINGIATYKSAKDLQHAIRDIPLERILIETDGPFLSPQPIRGERNVPWAVSFIAEKISEIKKISIDEVTTQTDENTISLFGLEGVL